MNKRAKHILRRPFEWLGIALALAIIAFLPRRAMLAVADFASAIMYAFDAKGRKHAIVNLKIIKPSLFNGRGEGIPRAAKSIVRRSYRNMARAVAHAFWTMRSAKRRVAEAGEMSARGKAFLAAHHPAITVSAHLGCWEILSQLAFLEGHVMMSVAKDIGSERMTKLLMRARKSIGQEIVRADGAFRPLMKGLKEGKSLGLLVDQPVRPEDGGMWVRFFGRPYPVSVAPAFFAAKGKAAIGVAWSRPLRDGRYRCEVLAEIAPGEARDIWQTTQRILEILERVIARHPSCWVLNYNAFRKHIKPAELEKLCANESKARNAQGGRQRADFGDGSR